MAPKSKMTDVKDPYEFPYMKPDKISKWKAFRRELYDPSTGAVLGRTATNWAALTLFYTIFFSVLAAMFSICMWGLLRSVSDREPRWQLEASLIGTNPGLGFRPLSQDVEKTGSLIWYQAKNETNIRTWTNELDSFLKDYLKESDDKRKVCGYDNLPTSDRACTVSMEDFAPCNQANGYSYNQSSPCVFIKLNRIFNWVPEFYNDTNNLPGEMDKELVDFINAQPASERNAIWVSCEGENVADTEAMGPIAYFPSRGFPGYYYPYTNTPGYLSPLVAIHFERPAKNTLINIECRAWAKNINYVKSRRDREGSVHFEIMVD